METLTSPAPTEMQDHCSLLCQEVLQWPGVKMYRLFGMCAFYHGRHMFALVPDKRSLIASTAMSFKSLHAECVGEDEEWHTLELAPSNIMNEALPSLKRAYSYGAAIP